MQRRRKCSSSGLRSSSAMMSSLHQKSWQQPFHHDQARKKLFFVVVVLPSFLLCTTTNFAAEFLQPHFHFTSLHFTSFYFFQILRLSINSLVLDHVVQNAQYFIFCVSPFLSFLLRDHFLLEICVPKIVFLVVVSFWNPEMHQPILQSYGSY